MKRKLMFIDLDERGKTTEYCRALHAKMGSYIGNGMRGGVTYRSIEARHPEC